MSEPLSPFALPRAAPAAKKGGSLPPPSSLPCGAPGEAGTSEAQPRFTFSQPTRGIRANPLPIRLSRQGPDHSSEGAPSEREALWLSKTCAT